MNLGIFAMWDFPILSLWKGENYRIGYIKASEGTDTKIEIPNCGDYEISGNNVDGFILTALC